MKILLFIVLLTVVAIVAYFVINWFVNKRSKPIGKDYIIVTDKVVAAGGPELPEGIDYRFYDTLRYTSGGYSYTEHNRLAIKFNGETYRREVSTGWDDPASALRDAAETLYKNFKRDYNAWSKEQQLKNFIHKTNDLPVIGKRVGWREDT